MVGRLIYASRATYSPDDDALLALLEVSRKRNDEADVTGLLVYAERSFLQLLEGPPAAVAEIYGRILIDERHRDIRLLVQDQVGSRLFPDWTMGFYAPNAESLVCDVPGYRPEIDYPFVAGDLVPNAEVADTLLQLWARDVP